MEKFDLDFENKAAEMENDAVAVVAVVVAGFDEKQMTTMIAHYSLDSCQIVDWFEWEAYLEDYSSSS